MILTDEAKRLQTEFLARLLAGGVVRILDEHGVVLTETRMSKEYVVDAKGKRITYPPLAESEVLRNGHAAIVQFYDAEAKVLVGQDFAGSHVAAVVKFDDPRLFQRMIIDYENNVVIEVHDSQETKQ